MVGGFGADCGPDPWGDLFLDFMFAFSAAGLLALVCAAGLGAHDVDSVKRESLEGGHQTNV